MAMKKNFMQLNSVPADNIPAKVANCLTRCWFPMTTISLQCFIGLKCPAFELSTSSNAKFD